MGALGEQYISRLRLALDSHFASNSGVDNIEDTKQLKLSNWLEKYTTSPLDTSKLWSFDDHEFQVDILDSPSPEVSVIKVAQVGLTEISIRYALAQCAMRQPSRAIYVLPTRGFSTELTKSRLDPAIESSKTLSAMVSKDVDNAGLKKIGTSFLYMRGSTGSSQVISVPADVLIVDELDFCKQDIVSLFMTRLQHSKVKLIRRFSTPTLPGFGIDLAYTDGSQAVRMVKCEHCSNWVYPNPLEHLMVTDSGGQWIGINVGDAEFDKETLRMVGRDGIKQSWLACPECGKDIRQSMLDLDRRQWVHKFPDRIKDHSSFRVAFYDVPSINSIGNVLQDLLAYRKKGDWVNNRLGYSYMDASSQFIISTVRNNSVVNGKPSGPVVIGVDLGKTSWIVCAAREGDKLKLFDCHSVKVAGLEEGLAQYLLNLFLKYKASCIVVDSMPDYSVAMSLSRMLPIGAAYGAFYVNSRKELDIQTVIDSKASVKIVRTEHFDELCSAVNAGRVLFPRGVSDVVLEHLDAMKRVVDSDSGEAYWEHIGDDHFAHALGYCWSASKRVEGEGIGGGWSPSNLISKVKLGARQQEQMSLGMW